MVAKEFAIVCGILRSPSSDYTLLYNCSWAEVFVVAAEMVILHTWKINDSGKGYLICNAIHYKPLHDEKRNATPLPRSTSHPT